MCSASPTEVKSELSVEEDIRLSRWETIVIKKLKKILIFIFKYDLCNGF